MVILILWICPRRVKEKIKKAHSPQSLKLWHAKVFLDGVRGRHLFSKRYLPRKSFNLIYLLPLGVNHLVIALGGFHVHGVVEQGEN